ncbi:sigma-70 family RNA polymerase sigma factor [Paenibacillus sp. HW567]|uniref:sigma-70 family RNA polymerase sigma factor n=1 Tax=Paenibacillus sp. HW567 TaxID=1034769 RepID=UPI00036E13AC|nr:sigma-70 family RNA polymerase sigma factor [Paenibacillus sp. HW567]
MKIIKEGDYKEFFEHLNMNPIIKNFLNDKNNYELLLLNITDPSLSNKIRLDEAFKSFYFEIRFTTYISSLIRFSSIDFDKKERRLEKRMILNLEDKYMTTQESFSNDAHLESIASSSLLYNGMLLLTMKEKEVLVESYINSLSDTEIAKKKNISQQAISKTRKNALKKLREFMTREEEK